MPRTERLAKRGNDLITAWPRDRRAAAGWALLGIVFGFPTIRCHRIALPLTPPRSTRSDSASTRAPPDPTERRRCGGDRRSSVSHNIFFLLGQIFIDCKKNENDRCSRFRVHVAGIGRNTRLGQSSKISWDAASLSQSACLNV
jgi:hypothetical protein